jgi:protease PrsW
MISAQTLLYALLGGILPAFLWLWFFLKEDQRRPEPRGLIMLSFVAGMIVVPLVIPFEKYVDTYFAGAMVIILWAAIEEIFKYAVAYIAVLRRKEMDEPIDAVIYMITVALGFAALENTLFLLNPLIEGDVINTIMNGNLRFVGAMLLHILSSATVGVFIAFAFYKSRRLKKACSFFGVILAIVLHSFFNFFIIESSGEKIFVVFLSVWIGIIILILLIEKIKLIISPGQFLYKIRNKYGKR